MEMAPGDDDLSILNDRILWRRVPQEWVIFDKNLNRHRPTSQAFQNTTGTQGMSANLADETTVAATLKGYESNLLAQVQAGLARELGQGIVRKPLDDNAAHCEVTGEKTKSVRDKFAKRCRWVVGPATEP